MVVALIGSHALNNNVPCGVFHYEGVSIMGELVV